MAKLFEESFSRKPPKFKGFFQYKDMSKQGTVSSQNRRDLEISLKAEKSLKLILFPLSTDTTIYKYYERRGESKITTDGREEYEKDILTALRTLLEHIRY